MDAPTPLTVRGLLFADVVGSTELRSRLGEDRADLLRRHHDEVMDRVVADHGGTVLRWTGDGMKASFPSASAALTAALDLQRAVARYRHRPDAVADLRVRVGVSAGEVVTEGGDDHGVAVVEGARLEALAAPDEVLATDLARQLGHRRVAARFEDVGPRRLKGLDEPVAVVRVVDTRPEVASVAVPKALEVDRRFPLVGRADEVARALAAWRAARDGTTRALLVAGQPGIGKSRLVGQVAERAHDEGALVLAGACDSDLAVPYQPFTGAFDAVVGLDEDLRRAVVDGAGPLGPLFPARRGGRGDDVGPAARFELFDAVGALLSRLAADRPVALVLEDLHWATSATVHLVRHLVQDAAVPGLLVVATYRAEEVDPSHPLYGVLAESRSAPAVTRVELAPIDVAAVEELVAARLPAAAPAARRAFAARVCEEAAGTPFFACAIVDHLSTDGTLAHVVGDGDGGRTLPVPDAVRDIVGHRLGRLAPGTADVLASAAVLGQGFDLDVLSELVGRSPEQALLAVEEGERGALVQEVDVGRFAFAHAIVRSALLATHSATRLALVHRRAAELLEARRPHDHDELARHWLAAREEARATEHLARAAERDMEALAFESAAERYRQVLDHHARRPPADPLVEARDRLGLGLALRAMSRVDYLPEVEEAGRRARALGDVDLTIDAAIASLWPGTFFITAGRTEEPLIELCEAARSVTGPDDPRRPTVLATLAAQLTFADARDRRVALLDEALDLARGLDDPDLVARVLIAEYLTAWDPTTIVRRGEVAAELTEIARTSTMADVQFFAGFFAGVGAAERGEVAEARSRLEALAPVVKASRNAYFGFLRDRLLVSLDLLACAPDVQDAIDALAARYEGTHADTAGTWALQTGGVAFQQGRLADLVPVLQGLVEESVLAPVWRAPLGLALLAGGDRDAAEQVLDGSSEPHLDYFWTTVVQTRAELAVGLGRLDHCRALYDTLLPHRGLLGITASGSLAYGLVDTTLGLLAVALGDLEAAVALLRGAVATADAMAAPYEGVKARRALAEALAAQGADGSDVAEVVAGARSVALAHGFAGELAVLGGLGAAP